MAFRFLLLACLVAMPLFADRWVRFRSGPFEVLTDAGERSGRETLYTLEQIRHALASVLGEKELRSLWPIRIVAFGSAREYPAGLALARDAFTGAAWARRPLAGATLRDCSRILIASTMNRLPEDMEQGIAAVFSTATTTGTRVTLGQPPPESERDVAWAKFHMLAVTPDYFGRLRVLAHNLNEGAAAEPAYRNAFGKTPEAIYKEAVTYLKAGNFPTVSVLGRVIRAEKEFAVARLEDQAVEVALADLLLADSSRRSEAGAAYQTVLKTAPESPEALEGLGLVELLAGRKEAARKSLCSAAATGASSARALLECALLEPAKAKLALAKAAEKNPRWAAPHFEMARLDSQPKKKVELLKTAAELEPRNAGYWRTLAEEYTTQERFQEAAEAWSSAEQAAPTEAERAQIGQLRAAIEKKRLDQEEAEKKRLAEEERRKIEELKRKAMESIEAALAEANKDSAPPKAGEKVVEWWDDPKAPAKLEGTLQRVDCLGTQARLVIEAQKAKITRLLVPELSRLSVRGAGELTFRCGPQRPARKIIVEYFPKDDAKLQTTGEAAVVEFLP